MGEGEKYVGDKYVGEKLWVGSMWVRFFKGEMCVGG